MKKPKRPKPSRHKLEKELREQKQAENKLWMPWHPGDSPAMKFAGCALDVLLPKPRHKFSDVPDFFASDYQTNFYFEAMRLCAVKYADAAARLHRIAASAVEALRSAAWEAPENFQPIARGEFVFPGFISHHPDVARNQEYLMEKIQLGESSSINTKGKSFSLFTDETHIAFQLLNYIKSIRKKDKSSLWTNGNFEALIEKEAIALPPLSRENYRQWWKLAEKVFVRKFGNDFENHKQFQDYWRNDAYQESVPDNPRKKKLLKSSRALIRRDIKSQIKQAFHSIAPKSPPV